MAIYKAAKGAGFTDKDAQVIGEHLESLGEKFSPHDVVRSASAEESPIHKHFTWDDAKASEQWRLQEARGLVNRLTIVVKVDGVKQEAKAFYSVAVRIEETNSVEPRYVKVTTARHDLALQRTILDDLLDDLNGITKKYDQFRQIIGAGMFEEIQKTVEKFSKPQARVAALKRMTTIQPSI